MICDSQSGRAFLLLYRTLTALTFMTHRTILLAPLTHAATLACVAKNPRTRFVNLYRMTLTIAVCPAYQLHARVHISCACNALFAIPIVRALAPSVDPRHIHIVYTVCHQIIVFIIHPSVFFSISYK